jgi:ribosomal protein S18 acetylase RimI-like enzyme
MRILHRRICAAEFSTFIITWRRGVFIRKATREDATGILACLSAAFEQYRDSYTSAAFTDTVLTVETIAKRLQDMTVFVATDKSGEIVGTIACGIVNAEEGHIRGMAVVPAFQGSGIAAQLLMRAEWHFREGNCKKISLDTTSPLERAIRLYERFGFSPSGKVQDFFGMPLMEYVKTI